VAKRDVGGAMAAQTDRLVNRRKDAAKEQARKEAAAARDDATTIEPMKKVTTYLPLDLYQRAKGAIHLVAGTNEPDLPPGCFTTFAELVSQALEEKLDRAVAELTPPGGDFQRLTKKLKGK